MRPAVYGDHVIARELRADELQGVATARLDPAESDDFPRRPRTNEELAEPGTMEAPTIQSILSESRGEVGLMLPIALEPWFLIGYKEFREKWIDLGEREYVRRLMVRTKRSSGAASREAGLERTYLYRLIKKHGV